MNFKDKNVIAKIKPERKIKTGNKNNNFNINVKKDSIDAGMNSKKNLIQNEENNNINNNIMSYDDLIKQSEEFKSNIEDIREHILD